MEFVAIRPCLKKKCIWLAVITIIIWSTRGRDSAVFTSPFSLPIGKEVYISVSHWEYEPK